jgi:hypothetical protein
MNVKQYRKRLEEQVASRKRDARTKPARRPAKSSTRSGQQERINAIDRMRFDGDSGDDIRNLVAILGNSDEPTKLRMAAFRALKTASFLGPLFAPHRADFLKTLRDVATDPEPEIRAEALETLAMEKVGIAQQLLSAGLQDPENALVPPAKAIQLLAYDDHAEAAPLVRRILARTRDHGVKEAAVRFLASDPGSATVFRRLLKDKSQPTRLRSLTARKIVEDSKEDDDLRATCLGALTFIKDFHKTRENPAFAKKVHKLSTSKRSGSLKASAKRFVARHGN